MPQNDLDDLTGRTTDGVSRTARYLQIFDGIVDAARAGDTEGARRGWAALPRWESLSEAERREIENPLIHKFEELSAAYAAAPVQTDDRDDEIDVRRVIKLCESVTVAFGNYETGTGLAAKQLAAEVPKLVGDHVKLKELKRAGYGIEEIRRLDAEIERLRERLNDNALRPPPSETQQSISRWAEDTFGPGGTNARAIARANREMAELLEHVTSDDRHPGAAEEIADIVIVLYRAATRLGVDLHQRIDAKMAKNRVRKWRLDGTGHGYHVKEAAPTTSNASARTLAASAEYGGGGSSIRRSGWLAKIEALEAGDACEVKDGLTGSWVPAVVLRNGGSGLWQIRREDGQSHMPYIEQVRLPGQTEAWR